MDLKTTAGGQLSSLGDPARGHILGRGSLRAGPFQLPGLIASAHHRITQPPIAYPPQAIA